MSIFSPAKFNAAYLKASVLGFSGTGKTFSATMAAIALHKYIHSSKPVFFLDTETGSGHVKKYFDRCQIPFETGKSRAFVDLMAGVAEAESRGDILIIDSISHFWQELIAAYKKKKNKTRITIRDWSEIKPEWYQFTERFLGSKLHILMLGRAGWEFDDFEDDEGIKEFRKTGTKMKVETDLGYEPDLILEIEKLRGTVGKIGGHFTHRMWIVKDRENLINGRFCDFPAIDDKDIDFTESNPVFKFILPYINTLNLGGEHKTLNLESNSQELFNNDRSAYEYQKRREIAIEEIEADINTAFPGRDQETIKTKIELLKTIFGTGSWTAICSMPSERLVELRKKIPDFVKSKRKGENK